MLLWVHVDLLQALFALFQALNAQGGLKWMVRRQVVVGPWTGLVGAV